MKLIILKSGIFSVKLPNRKSCWCAKVYDADMDDSFLLFNLSENEFISNDAPLFLKYFELIPFTEFPITKIEYTGDNLIQSEILNIMKFFDQMDIILRTVDVDVLTDLMVKYHVSIQTVCLIIKGLKLLACDEIRRQNSLQNRIESNETISRTVDSIYSEFKKLNMII